MTDSATPDPIEPESWLGPPTTGDPALESLVRLPIVARLGNRCRLSAGRVELVVGFEVMCRLPKEDRRTLGFISCVCLAVLGLSPIVSADCPTRSGYVVQEPSDPNAIISYVRDCDYVVTIRLSELIGHEPDGQPVKIDHAELKVQLQPGQWVFGCHDEHGQRTATVAITHRGADWREPHIFRAWKADLKSWTFEEFFDGPEICRTPPPISCGQSN